MKKMLIGLAFLLSLNLGFLAIAVFCCCFLPWWESADQAHVSMYVGGVEFAGWSILIPLIGFFAGAIGAGGCGIWMLKKRG